MSRRLFDEFPTISTEAWMEVVHKDLKGSDFVKRLVTKTEDGIAIRPIYRTEDRSESSLTIPGSSPYRRGYTKDSNDWQIREQVREPNLAEANAHALRALHRGAQEIAFLTYPMGPEVGSAEAMQEILAGIFIEMVAVHWMAGPFSAPTLALYVQEARRRNLKIENLSGSIDGDPILDALCAWTTAKPEDWKQDLLPVAKFVGAQMPRFRYLTIRGSLLEKAGASATQELAWTLALLTEYLSGLDDEGIPPSEAIHHTEVRLAVGSHYLFEIAKLRAARVLLSRLLEGFGVLEGRPWLHVDTTSSNKTLYDPYNNMLRGTTEAMSAAIAGIDSMTVAAFDAGYRVPDEFSEHIARNTGTLLKEEAFFTKVVDPLGGAYAIEVLTDSIVDSAWNHFLEIEEAGGFLASWNSGSLPKRLEETRQQITQSANLRRCSIVGTNTYPNLSEERLSDLEVLAKQPQVEPWYRAFESFDALYEAYTQGRTLADERTTTPIPDTPLTALRPAQPFEELRLAVERHTMAGGKRPLVLLVPAGDPARRKARVGFCLGFFGCAGYDVREADATSDMTQAAKSCAEAEADLVVLCSSDEEYMTFTEPLAQGLREVGSKAPIVIAGYPQDALEALKQAGAVDFVHLRTDAIKMLAQFHRQFSIPEVNS